MTTATTSPPEPPIRLRAQRLQSGIRWQALIVEMLRAATQGGPTLDRDSAGALVYALPRFRWYTPDKAGQGSGGWTLRSAHSVFALKQS
jgi:hypothetical protein